MGSFVDRVVTCNVHAKLDAAVFTAYGWDPSMTDDQLLESLLTLN